VSTRRASLVLIVAVIVLAISMLFFTATLGLIDMLTLGPGSWGSGNLACASFNWMGSTIAICKSTHVEGIGRFL